MDKPRLLKTTMSFFQNKKRLNYDAALKRIATAIQTKQSDNNPLLADCIRYDLPSTLKELHDLMMPGVDCG